MQLSFTFIQRTLTAGLVGASLSAATAVAQVGVETFAGGNPDGWQIWFAPYNYLRATGGNPGEYFELDNVTSGPLTCQFLDIFPDRLTAVTLSHAGNWRAAGIDQVSIDVNIRTGPLNGLLTILLVSDPGTPTMTADDCTIRLTQTNPGPVAIGWTTLTFDVDTAQMTAPSGWSVDPASMRSASATTRPPASARSRAGSSGSTTSLSETRARARPASTTARPSPTPRAAPPR
jgi:hypothetical protein